MSIPNYLGVVEDVKRRYPAEWAAAHRGGPDTEAFIRRLAFELYQEDPNVGLNGKRGNPGDLSDDCICYKGQGGQSLDVRTGQRVAVIDVIAGAGGQNPQPAWGEVWDPANIPTAATWVQPTPVGGEVPTPGPTPPPTTPAPPPGLTPAEVQAMIDAAVTKALAPVYAELAVRPTYNSTIALEADSGALLCAEGGGPTSDFETFTLTSRSIIGPWESWRIRKG